MIAPRIKSPLQFPTEPSLDAEEVLTQWLERNKFSQKELATETGLSPGFVSMLLNKKRKMTTGIVSLIADATGTKDADWVRHMELHDEWSRKADLPVEPARSFSGGVQSNQDIRTALSMGVVRITDLDDANIKESSVDLTLGASKRLPPPSWLSQPTNELAAAAFAEASVKKERHLIVRPGESWLTWSREKIRLDRLFCGRIGGMGDLTIHGIHLVFGTQVNAGWEGHPFATLYNPTGEPFQLDPGQPFMTLEISALSSPAILTTTDERGPP